MSSKTTTLLSTNDQFEHSQLTAWLDPAGSRLCAIDDSGMVVMPNQAACSMLGVLATEVQGRNCRFLQGTKPHQPGLAVIRTGINLQANGYAKLRNLSEDDSLFSNALFIAPVQDANGVVSRFVGIHPLEASEVSP